MDLLARLRQSGGELLLEGDKLRLRAPKGALADDLRAALAARRDEIVEFLRRAQGGEDSPRARDDPPRPPRSPPAALLLPDPSLVPRPPGAGERDLYPPLRPAPERRALAGDPRRGPRRGGAPARGPADHLRGARRRAGAGDRSGGPLAAAPRRPRRAAGGGPGGGGAAARRERRGAAVRPRAGAALPRRPAAARRRRAPPPARDPSHRRRRLVAGGAGRGDHGALRRRSRRRASRRCRSCPSSTPTSRPGSAAGSRARSGGGSSPTGGIGSPARRPSSSCRPTGRAPPCRPARWGG